MKVGPRGGGLRWSAPLGVEEGRKPRAAAGDERDGIGVFFTWIDLWCIIFGRGFFA